MGRVEADDGTVYRREACVETAGGEEESVGGAFSPCSMGVRDKGGCDRVCVKGCNSVCVREGVRGCVRGMNGWRGRERG